MISRALELLNRLLTGQLGCGCETCPMAAPTVRRKVMLVGPPNVGKSVIFNSLTGRYVVVSNYPGTTVEVSRGHARVGDVWLEVVDSPGAYSLSPFSEDERVTQDLLIGEPADVIVHVVDARNLPRLLPLTFQLIEAGLPVALDVNIIDEAERSGMSVDPVRLSADLGLPVVATAAARNLGMDRLRALLSDGTPAKSGFRVDYPEPIEAAIARLGELLAGEYGIAPRAVALLLLERDPGMWEKLHRTDPEVVGQVEQVVAEVEAQHRDPLSYPIAVARQRAAERVARRALTQGPRPVRRDAGEVLGAIAAHPVAGIPVLAAVLYFGLYLIVGKIGAGVVVDFLDEEVFGHLLNPAMEAAVRRVAPWTVFADLFVGEYGVLTLGLRYAIAIVLPLVGAFFFIFALLEDTGYLPRLALLVDRAFKRIGLSGRAVIPIVLGLGCGTMATLVTRVLATRRERLIATFLLALAIPCSAQLGVILGLLAGHPLALAIWGLVIGGGFLVSGFLAAKVVPGAPAYFYLEIPPMRWPSFGNIATKTISRVKWYALEVIPIFLLTSVLIWIGQLTRLFQLAIALLRPAVNAIGLPDEAADAFLFGFLRRDYGAARIFDIHGDGAISGIPLVVAMVTITLFVPCVAQFLVMVRERGLRVALAVGAIILPVAFGVGYLLNITLTTFRVPL